MVGTEVTEESHSVPTDKTNGWYWRQWGISFHSHWQNKWLVLKTVRDLVPFPLTKQVVGTEVTEDPHSIPTDKRNGRYWSHWGTSFYSHWQKKWLVLKSLRNLILFPLTKQMVGSEVTEGSHSVPTDWTNGRYWSHWGTSFYSHWKKTNGWYWSHWGISF